MTEKIVVDKPKFKVCLYKQRKKNAKDLLRFTLCDEIVSQLCMSVFCKRLE